MKRLLILPVLLLALAGCGSTHTSTTVVRNTTTVVKPAPPAKAIAIAKATATTVVAPPVVVTPTPNYPAPAYSPFAFTQLFFNISATQGISSALANNVFYRYWLAIQNNQDTSSLSAWSSVSNQWYGADCYLLNATVFCSISGTTDPNAGVAFPQSAVDAYTQANADTYATSPMAGP